MPYVYRHIRLDKNQPFYIGVGKEDDFDYERAYDKYSRNPIWKLIATKTEYSIEILFEQIPLDFAYKKEIEFIKLYGRIDLENGTLANLTDGGDGAVNVVITEEHRKKIVAAARARDNSKEADKFRKWREAGGKQIITEEHRKNLSEGLKGINAHGFKAYNFRGIITAYKEGESIGDFMGVHKCAAAIGITATKISACLNNRRKSFKGWTFVRHSFDKQKFKSNGKDRNL